MFKASRLKTSHRLKMGCRLQLCNGIMEAYCGLLAIGLSRQRRNGLLGGNALSNLALTRSAQNGK